MTMIWIICGVSILLLAVAITIWTRFRVKLPFESVVIERWRRPIRLHTDFVNLESVCPDWEEDDLAVCGCPLGDDDSDDDCFIGMGGFDCDCDECNEDDFAVDIESLGIWGDD